MGVASAYSFPRLVAAHQGAANLSSFFAIFRSRRGVSLFFTNSLVFFGLTSGGLQLYLALWPESLTVGLWVTVLLLITSLFVGISSATTRDSISHSISHPDCEITVRKGNLFDERGNLVVGFTDTFDTDMSGDVVISRSSVQGQFQSIYYPGTTEELDIKIEQALIGAGALVTEERANKPLGKLTRYPIGSVAILNEPDSRFFCLAYGLMKNTLTVTCDVDSIWVSLGRLWEAVRDHGQREPVHIPVIGTEMARVSSLSRESLLKIILLSFVAHSRREEITKSITVLIHPKDFDKFNMIELRAFLSTL